MKHPLLLKSLDVLAGISLLIFLSVPWCMEQSATDSGVDIGDVVDKFLKLYFVFGIMFFFSIIWLVIRYSEN